jgi:hypothetical protein
MLAGWSKPLVIRTTEVQSTLSGITRKSINDRIAYLQREFSADQIEDITDEGLKRKFVKMFGEDKPVAEEPQIPVDNASE